LALVFFLTPLALIAGGDHGHPFENRQLEPAPALSDGWNVFNVATRYLIDHLPGRDRAVQANTWIDEHIFHTTPNYGQNGLGGVGADQALPFSGSPDQDKATLGTATPGTTTGKGGGPTAPPAPTASQVTVGTHGWFFLEGVLQRACAPFVPFTTAAGDWEALLGAIRASGRKAILVIAPDKSSVYPEYLSPSTPDLQCGLAGTQKLWSVIESAAAQRAGIIGLRQPLLATKRQDSATPLYYKTDSHWNTAGALAMTEAVLPPFGSKVRVAPSEIVHGPDAPWVGDLLALLGQSGHEEAPTRSISRRPSAPKITAPTLLIGDSYADAPLPQMQHYFSHLSYINWNDSTPAKEAQAIFTARYVILETVEREFDYRASTVGFVSPKIVSYLSRELASHPLR
jgi:alginate O-acetyltransferase complex protein AlgJ